MLETAKKAWIEAGNNQALESLKMRLSMMKLYAWLGVELKKLAIIFYCLSTLKKSHHSHFMFKICAHTEYHSHPG